MYNQIMRPQTTEGEGFEPSIQVDPVCRFSKPVPSASRPPLHMRWENGTACLINGRVRECMIVAALQVGNVLSEKRRVTSDEWRMASINKGTAPSAVPNPSLVTRHSSLTLQRRAEDSNL
jgi:hypothetical protein